MARILVLLGLLIFPLLFRAPALAANSAVIFMYHRFGEGDVPSTSISIEQLEAHIKELQSGGYHVMALADIVAALKSGHPLPDRAIGITVDDAFLSVYTEAWPRFRAAGFPFTVFVATEPVDDKTRGYMTWQQISDLKAGGVTIGAHTASHSHMASSGDPENRLELEKSNSRFAAELGGVPELFAYPYGEAGLEVMARVRKTGYIAAFGQHSGVAGAQSNLYYLPRFALNEKYGEIDRFRLAANALPLPVGDITPADPRIGAGDDNPPAVGFTLKGGSSGVVATAQNLSCFASREGKASVTALGGENGGDVRIEVRMTKPMPAGRTRLNCTLLASDGRWRWFGRLFFVDK